MSESPSSFPQVVTVRVCPAKAGVAVKLTFGMTHKNSFGGIWFTDSNGTLRLTADELLLQFDADRNLFIMDYVDPRTAFSGRVSARVMDQLDLQGALGAFETFSRVCGYPAGYRARLQHAMESGQDPDGVSVELDVR